MINIWIKILTGNNLWAKIERDIITQQILNKGGISINAALSSNPIKTKFWPDRWKPFIKAWKKVEGSIGENKEPWPWVPESILLANEQSNTYSVKKIVQFLRNKSITTSITQNNLISNSTAPLH
ncbi:3380_t:CDS:1, partial [Gigaspora margarita]